MQKLKVPALVGSAICLAVALVFFFIGRSANLAAYQDPTGSYVTALSFWLLSLVFAIIFRVARNRERKARGQATRINLFNAFAIVSAGFGLFCLLYIGPHGLIFAGLLFLIAGGFYIGGRQAQGKQKRTTPVYNLPPTQKVDSFVFRPTPTAPVFKQAEIKRESTPSLSSAFPKEKMGGPITRLGNYRLIRLLGEGGFAEVYLGEHIHLNTPAAIKVLHTQLAKDDIESFRTEARTVARLIHPHIIRILDFDVEGKIPFLVMDYAPLGTLRKAHPRGKPLSLSTVVFYVKQVAEALQYAHDEKLIHRDVKPENMLIGRRNEVLLGDFGIAVIAHNTYSQKAQGMSGTVAYMAPEQIQEYPRPASDQYSLGIVAYEWLTGNWPFQGTYNEIVVKHMNVAPPSLRQKVPTISSAVEQVVLKALAKDPKERFESVRAFAAALERAARV